MDIKSCCLGDRASTTWRPYGVPLVPKWKERFIFVSSYTFWTSRIERQNPGMPRLIISWSLGNVDSADDVAYCSLLVFRAGHTGLWGVGLRAKEHAWEVILLVLQLDQSDKVEPDSALLLRKCCSSFDLMVRSEEDVYVAGYCLELLIK